MLTSRYLVGTDGMTANECRRGRRCRLPLAQFGETVWYRKYEKHKAANRMESRWEKGVWLGHTRDSNEAIIGTIDAAVRAYAVTGMAADERWNAENIKHMQGLPQQPDPKRPGLRVPIRITLGDEVIEAQPREVQKDIEPLPRRMGITVTELEKYGYTDKCPGCLAKRRGAVAKKGHSEACRKRIEELMKQDDNDKQKMLRTDERITAQIARRIERSDQKGTGTQDEPMGENQEGQREPTPGLLVPRGPGAPRDLVQKMAPTMLIRWTRRSRQKQEWRMSQWIRRWPWRQQRS